MTRSPGRYWVAPPPTAAITPEVSWPKMGGAEWEPVEIFLRSVPQTPQECTRSSISPGPIVGTGTVSTRTSFMPRYTAACMVVGMDCEGSSTAWESAVAMCVTLDDVSTAPGAVLAPASCWPSQFHGGNRIRCVLMASARAECPRDSRRDAGATSITTSKCFSCYAAQNFD